MADLFSDLPQWRPQMAERARELKSELASLTGEGSEARSAIDRRVEAFNTDWRELDRLIGEQFWRVAFHRVAEDEINYRRFFNINDLAGLRMEIDPVFDARACPSVPHARKRRNRRPADRSYRWAV